MRLWKKLSSAVAGGGLLAALAVASQVPTAEAAAFPASTDTRTASEFAKAPALPRLKGYVGSDGTITINRRTVVEGRYRIVVTDDTSAHNWHIAGPGVDRTTTVTGIGTWSWTVRLRRGTYAIVCDPHASWMHTSLRVTRG